MIGTLPVPRVSGARKAVQASQAREAVKQPALKTMKEKLVHLVTRWDARQSSRRDHNPYALGQYLAAVDTVAEKIAAGMPVDMAIDAVFCGRLAAFLVKNARP